MAGDTASLEARVLDLVGDIQGLLDLDEFREGLIVALRRVVGCDWVSVNEFGPEPEDVWSLVVPPVSEEVLELFGYYARLLGVALSNREHDFSDADRELVNRARPFLIQGYRNAIDYGGAQKDGRSSLAGALVSAGLTPRESEAMRLVALGRSNADVADALGLSIRTVHKHLEHAFAKLGVHSRSEASARAWSLASRDGAGPA